MPRFLRLTSVFCSIVTMVLAILPESLWAAIPMVHQDGTRIVDSDGTPLALRGVNLGGWLHWEGWIWGKGIFRSETDVLSKMTELIGPEATHQFETDVYEKYITDADIAKIREAGFNSVRVPINRRLLEDDDRPFHYKEDGFRILDRLLDSCARHRLHVILDLHSAPGGQANIATADPGPKSGLLWNSDLNRKRTLALWQAIASRYRNNPTVAGYDLLNEPNFPDSSALINLYGDLIAAIRRIDPEHMIILEGNSLARDLDLFDHPLAPNIAYSFHMYTWFGDDRKPKLAKYLKIASHSHVPLWAGEFGENSYDMIRTTREMYEGSPDIIAGWCYWTWKKTNTTKYPGLVTFSISDNWKKTIGWINFSFLKFTPDKEVVKTGIREFLHAATQDATLDSQMVAALLH